MKYRVKTEWDNIRCKNYYVYHLDINNNAIKDDEHYIVCNSIPLHEDTNANKACYIDTKRCKWVFDEDKYLEMIGYPNKHDEIPLDKIHDNIKDIATRLDIILEVLNKSVSHLNEANNKLTELK